MTLRPDKGPILGSGLLQSVSIGLLIIGGVMFYASRSNADARPIGLAALAIGVVAVAFVSYRFWRLRKALGKADLIFDDPVPLGFSGTATYSRPMHGAEMRSIEVRLQCEEEIVRGSGKNKGRVTKIVHDEVLAAAVTPMMERIEVRVPLKIPATGPATFWCSTAETKWWVRLRLKMSGCPNTASSFEIQVVPGVAKL